MNLLIYAQRNIMEYWTLYKRLTIENHMTLSFCTVETVKYLCITIRDTSMHFGEGRTHR